jgi:hypothetical protein
MKFGKYEIEYQEFDPKKAEAWLNANRENRVLRPGVVEKYTVDMKGGRWTQCFVPICIDTDGNIADGQHRLWAIIESGTTQWFLVVRGVSKGEKLNIDTGLPRSLIDNLVLAGHEKPTTNLVTCVRWIEWGGPSPAKRAASNSEVDALLQKHHDAAAFAAYKIKGKAIAKGCVTGAVGRAFYHEKDHEALARFCHVLTSGHEAGSHESAAITLRNFCLNQALRGVNSTDAMKDTFLRAQNAIQHFLHGKKIIALRPCSEEAYPLPKAKKVPA